MKLENFPPRNNDAQKKEIENIKNIQKERFKSKDKSILDDSELASSYPIRRPTKPISNIIILRIKMTLSFQTIKSK